MKGPSLSEIKETYTVKELATLMKCSDQTIRALLKSKGVRGLKVGRSWRIAHSEVVRLTRLEM